MFRSICIGELIAIATLAFCFGLARALESDSKQTSGLPQYRDWTVSIGSALFGLESHKPWDTEEWITYVHYGIGSSRTKYSAEDLVTLAGICGALFLAGVIGFRWIRRNAPKTDPLPPAT